MASLFPIEMDFIVKKKYSLKIKRFEMIGMNV